MRGKQALKNMVASLLLQVIVLLSGLILPRFILEAYGSSVNGMITSVNQFLTYLGLAEAGVGTATVVALYTPLALKQTEEVNSILSATRKFYNKSGMLFLALTLVLIGVYPFFISGQLENSLVRWMILVLAGSTLVDYFFLGKYRVLLTANQEGYVVALIQAAGVLFVKAVATGVYMLRLVLVKIYVKRKYPALDFYAEPNEGALKQKNAALLHQVVGIIVNNTDTTVLTICLGAKSLLEVSVYGIYMMVVNAVNQLMTSFSNGLTAGFGEVIAKNEEETLKKSYSSYEYMYFVIMFIVIACMGVLILPFVGVYTINLTDVQYVRPVLGILFTLIVFMQNVRIPGLTIICAAGHYKETRYQAILEAVINITVSLGLVWKFGMAGVLLGTVCSYGYRSFEIVFYTSRHLVKGCAKKSMFRILRNVFTVAILCTVGTYVIPQEITSFTTWFLYAIGIGLTSVFLVVVINYVVEPDEFMQLRHRVNDIIKKE